MRKPALDPDIRSHNPTRRTGQPRPYASTIGLLASDCIIDTHTTILYFLSFFSLLLFYILLCKNIFKSSRFLLTRSDISSFFSDVSPVCLSSAKKSFQFHPAPTSSSLIELLTGKFRYGFRLHHWGSSSFATLISLFYRFQPKPKIILSLSGLAAFMDRYFTVFFERTGRISLLLE